MYCPNICLYLMVWLPACRCGYLCNIFLHYEQIQCRTILCGCCYSSSQFIFPLFYNFCRNHCPFVSLACNVRAVWSMNVCMFVSLYCYIFEFLLYLCSLYCHISCLSGWIPSTQSAYRVSFILFLRLGFCLLLLLLLLPLSNTKQQ